MRLFIAINFNDEIKDNLCGIIKEIKSNAKQGNFTKRENLHLTLVFIGETTNIDSVKRAMDTIKTKPFELFIGGLGKFKRSGGDIYWIGVQKNQSLSEIYIRLCSELSKVGFKVENREYNPHLTLGREIILDDSFDINVFQKMVSNISVSKLSLMKSERIAGRLIYSEVYAKQLSND